MRNCPGCGDQGRGASSAWTLYDKDRVPSRTGLESHTATVHVHCLNGQMSTCLMKTTWSK